MYKIIYKKRYTSELTLPTIRNNQNSMGRSCWSEQNRVARSQTTIASIRVVHVDVSVPKDTVLIPKGPDISATRNSH